MNNQEKIRVGIIGYGNMGMQHAANIRKNSIVSMELAAICDTSQTRLDAANKAMPEVTLFNNAEDMYKSGLCDMVLIAVPHYDHPELAIKAFEYGLNVLVEKPAGVYTLQVKEMNEEMLVNILKKRIKQRIEREYNKSRRLGLLNEN